MSACCYAATNRQTPRHALRVGEVFAWILSSALLMMLPKCPVCLAAHVALWTGLGLSLAMAAYLRWALLFLGVAPLLFLIVKWLHRFNPRARIRAH